MRKGGGGLRVGEERRGGKNNIKRGRTNKTATEKKKEKGKIPREEESVYLGGKKKKR